MRIIVAAVVGGIIVFVWSAVAHLLTPLGTMGLGSLPDQTMTAFASVPSSGMYFFPGIDMKNATSDQRKAWQQKLQSGPSGLLVITKGSAAGMTPQALGTKFASDVVSALLAAIVVSFMIGSWLRRAFAVALIGAFSVISLLVPYWIWYGFTAPFLGAAFAAAVVGWFLAGLAIATIVKPPFVAIAPAYP